MSILSTHPVEPLSPDLVPSISNTHASLVLARIANSLLALEKDHDPQIETGIIRCEIIEVFRSSTLKPGAVIEVPASRIADPLIRVRNRFDQWNNLPLKPGQLLVMACEILAVPSTWKAIAAEPVKSPVAPEIKAVRQCLVIEEFSADPARKHEMLFDALESPERLLRYYALDAIGRRAVVDRKTGVRLIAKAITSPSVTADNKLELGVVLTSNAFFHKDRHAEASNGMAVATLAEGMVREPDPAHRLEWAKYLASCVLIEFSPVSHADREIRTSLVKSIQNPPHEEVESKLSSLSHIGATDEQAVVRSLLEAWRNAFAEQH